MAAHRLGPARAADVAVEADHAVGRRHHHVKVVADQQHAAAVALAHLLDQRVELELAGEVDALGGLVEQQQVGLARERAGERDALELAARELGHQRPLEVAGADLGERLEVAATPSEREKTADAERQRRVELQALRHVADAEARAAHDAAGGRREHPQEHAEQRGLAGAVGADQRDDLAGVEREIDAAQQLVAADADADACGLDQGRAQALVPHERQVPRTSTVWPATVKRWRAACSAIARPIAGAANSATPPQPSQIRNWPSCEASGTGQPT